MFLPLLKMAFDVFESHFISLKNQNSLLNKLFH
jgi:hypothetical protein